MRQVVSNKYNLRHVVGMGGEGNPGIPSETRNPWGETRKDLGRETRNSGAKPGIPTRPRNPEWGGAKPGIPWPRNLEFPEGPEIVFFAMFAPLAGCGTWNSWWTVVTIKEEVEEG